MFEPLVTTVMGCKALLCYLGYNSLYFGRIKSVYNYTAEIVGVLMAIIFLVESPQTLFNKLFSVYSKSVWC